MITSIKPSKFTNDKTIKFEDLSDYYDYLKWCFSTLNTLSKDTINKPLQNKIAKECKKAVKHIESLENKKQEVTKEELLPYTAWFRGLNDGLTTIEENEVVLQVLVPNFMKSVDRGIKAGSTLFKQ